MSAISPLPTRVRSPAVSSLPKTIHKFVCYTGERCGQCISRSYDCAMWALRWFCRSLRTRYQRPHLFWPLRIKVLGPNLSQLLPLLIPKLIARAISLNACGSMVSKWIEIEGIVCSSLRLLAEARRDGISLQSALSRPAPNISWELPPIPHNNHPESTAESTGTSKPRIDHLLESVGDLVEMISPEDLTELLKSTPQEQRNAFLNIARPMCQLSKRPCNELAGAVILSSNLRHTYCDKAIKNHLNQKRICPITGQSLKWIFYPYASPPRAETIDGRKLNWSAEQCSNVIVELAKTKLNPQYHPSLQGKSWSSKALKGVKALFSRMTQGMVASYPYRFILQLGKIARVVDRIQMTRIAITIYFFLRPALRSLGFNSQAIEISRPFFTSFFNYWVINFFSSLNVNPTYRLLRGLFAGDKKYAHAKLMMKSLFLAQLAQLAWSAWIAPYYHKKDIVAARENNPDRHYIELNEYLTRPFDIRSEFEALIFQRLLLSPEHMKLSLLAERMESTCRISYARITDKRKIAVLDTTLKQIYLFSNIKSYFDNNRNLQCPTTKLYPKAILMPFKNDYTLTRTNPYVARNHYIQFGEQMREFCDAYNAKEKEELQNIDALISAT